MNLYEASNQWATRPADERFWTVAEMGAACVRHAENSTVIERTYADLSTKAVDGEITLVGKGGIPLRFSHYAFGQFSRNVGAPAEFMRSLPASIASDALNHQLAKREPGSANLLVHKNGALRLRAVTSDRYDRIWDHEVCAKLEPLTAEGWVAPPAYATSDVNARLATVDDCRVATSVKPGDKIGPAGLYASDHDMFAFLVNPAKTLGNEDMSRGLIVRNSEVGDGSLVAKFFYYKHTCGNHIVWNAKGVREIRVRHLGQSATRALRTFAVDAIRYADTGASEAEAMVESAKRKILGATKDEVLDAVLSFARAKNLGLSSKLVGEAYVTAEKYEARYGNPRSLWGVVSGLTQNSQAIPFADKRSDVDTDAGKLLEMAF